MMRSLPRRVIYTRCFKSGPRASSSISSNSSGGSVIYTVGRTMAGGGLWAAAVEGRWVRGDRDSRSRGLATRDFRLPPLRAEYNLPARKRGTTIGRRFSASRFAHDDDIIIIYPHTVLSL